MLDDSFREEAARSRGFFPLVGDLRLTSEVEDLDLPSRVRLREPGGLEDGLVSPSRVSADAGEERPSPLLALSPLASLACPFCLHILSEALFTSALLFPRSADRRLSLCRRALLKNDMPFSASGLLPLCCPLVDTLGERRLVTEELLLELRTSLRQLSPLLGSGDRAAGLPVRPSTTGLACTESLLKLLSASFFRPPVQLFSATLEVFFAAG